MAKLKISELVAATATNENHSMPGTVRRGLQEETSG
jgi:hypothetical protein